jgi:transposase-like protein
VNACGTITVPRGSFLLMRNALLQQVVEEAGSIRQAAKLLDVPRSTLGVWLRQVDVPKTNPTVDQPPDLGPGDERREWRQS